MRVRELEVMLAKALGYPLGQIDQRMRPLRENGLVPMGGHGLHAPDIEPVHAAVMLLQLVSLRAADAFAAGHTAMNLEFVPVPGSTNAFFGVDETRRLTLGAALAWLLTDPVAKWHRVEVSCNGRRAWVTIEHQGAPLDLVFVQDREAVARLVAGDSKIYQRQGAADMGHRFVLGVGMVKQIGLKVRGEAAPATAGGVDATTLEFRRLLDEAIARPARRDPVGAH